MITENIYKTHFDPNEMSISVEVDGGSPYPINLKSCKNSSALLYRILQAHGKSGCSAEEFRSIFIELDKACKQTFGENAQAVFCPYDSDQEVDWKARTHKKRVPY
jgi:hypothetical protein